MSVLHGMQHERDAAVLTRPISSSSSYSGMTGVLFSPWMAVSFSSGIISAAAVSGMVRGVRLMELPPRILSLRPVKTVARPPVPPVGGFGPGCLCHDGPENDTRK
jgi:hypothetical protein